MSYCYDVMSRAWEMLRQDLPPGVRDGELSFRFEMLISEMHEANHRLRDAINHDSQVHDSARKIDLLLDTINAQGHNTIG